MRNYRMALKILILCVWVLNGCAAGAPQDQKVKANHDEALVFGRIILLNVKNQHKAKVFVKEAYREMATSYPLSADGYFCWNLKPGKYNIVSFHIIKSWGRIWVDFEVPANEKYIYIGSLSVKASAISEVEITDDYDFDVDKMADQYGIGDQEIITRLMTKEEI